ncbi:longevity-assurance protein [Gonapodya prolifera JEL478]|uniref:Longevity-assurance protein n=1 Tax=Gonapodya prolifera (strain JEL478) TaxID=1344416 RepID=A0A139ANC2_GONPJ|nr:longevity-assurance protein [Gonapodya prolifera JEL478]|eukprot:KXS18218.1 longevity-assurance protein [Gonapodya prolifera JEL478]
MWNSLCHIWLCGLTLVAMWDEPWVYDTPTWFTEWPGIEMNDAMKFMYQWYIAYTIYSFLDIIFSTSARQKDFSQMMVHHSTTFFLCTFSFYFGFHRVGAVMMFIHDISDPPMEIAKLFLYTGYQQMADLTFVFFALVFAYTRIWLYPRHVLTAVWFYGPRTFPDGTRADWLFYIVCSALLALLALHVFWIWLIGVIIFKALRDGNVEGDVRDEMEDE